MRENGLSPEIVVADGHCELVVPHDDHGAFRYGVRARGYRSPTFAWAERPAPERHRHYRAMAQTAEGEPTHYITGHSRDQVIHDLLNRYARFRAARRMP